MDAEHSLTGATPDRYGEREGRIVRDDILLVGDDAEMIRVVAAALAERGLAVRRVAAVDDAVDALASAAAVVLVADATSTDPSDGVRRLQAGRRAPIVLVAKGASIDFAVRAVKAGVFDVVDLDATDAGAVAAKVAAAVDDGAGVRGAARLLRPAFVGRVSERAFFMTELERVCAGEGRTILLAGDDGAGKTSLARELARLARERGALVLWGHCEDSRAAPAYWPWTQLLGAYANAVGMDLLREDAAGAAASIASLVRRSVRRSRAQLPTRFHVVDGVVQCLRRAAARRPIVCVLDDLHHADGDSLHLLRRLVAQMGDARCSCSGAP
jgi:ActR/RegA family two-component response regulator